MTLGELLRTFNGYPLDTEIVVHSYGGHGYALGRLLYSIKYGEMVYSYRPSGTVRLIALVTED